MDILKNRRPERKRIGELLVEAGIIKPEKVPEGLKVVRQTGLPLGRVLIMLGVLNEHDLESALQIQQMLRDGLVPGELAMKALRLSASKNLSVEEALKQVGWQPPEQVTQASELGELLLSCGAITRHQLDDALQKTVRGGMPIGRYLILQGGLAPSTLAAALTAQVFLRDGKITREQAVHGLRLAMLKRTSIEQALAYQGVIEPAKKDQIKLGELLGSAAVVMECDTLTAVELGLEREEPMGQILVEAGLIPRAALEAALKLQEMVSCQILNAMQAASVLRLMKARGLTVSDALAESGLLQEQESKMGAVLELLKISGIISEAQLRQIEADAAGGAAGVRAALLSSRLIDDSLLQSATRCCALVRDGLLKPEQAIIALNYCYRSRISLQDAFEELVWDIPIERA